MKTTMKLLGETIRKARESKNISQKELADQLKKTPTYISIIERGVQTPSIELMTKIGKILDLPYPLLVLYSTDISEVPEQNRNAFEALKKSAANLVESMFKVEPA